MLMLLLFALLLLAFFGGIWINPWLFLVLILVVALVVYDRPYQRW